MLDYHPKEIGFLYRLYEAGYLTEEQIREAVHDFIMQQDRISNSSTSSLPSQHSHLPITD